MNKEEKRMITEALSVCISRKNNRINKLQRMLKQLEIKNGDGTHHLRKNISKRYEDMKQFENLKRNFHL